MASLNEVVTLSYSDSDMEISIIIPVFNRPSEVRSLLESLCQQTDTAFETVVVEDGSSCTCVNEVEAYRDKLDIKYVYKENSGPGLSRNEGCRNARGNYFIFLDSDCILPPQYISVVRQNLSTNFADAFGGPDEARDDFTPLQRAINYSMTSFFTTGGIRGGSEKLGKFHPRSFNMGFSRRVFDETGGFSTMRFGEDIDMSVRITDKGFRTQLIKEAYVYHRRRTNLRRFFKQVFNSGIARINLYKRHRGSLKIVHTAPAVFTAGIALILILSAVVTPYPLLLLLFHAAFILLDASVRNRSLYIGLLAVVTSYVQLVGYGTGFFHGAFRRLVLKKSEFAAFEKSFYK
ncbi:glycosyltransferase [Parapedobacter deserti]|uniref:Glycosyltransferase n=1 Tax=Parapedobacter deserti TaxID=1912957 RepID=A0ABV7JFZ4_9SPHI